MVVARTKLMIHDDILKPTPRIFVTYSGPRPDKFYRIIPNLMSSVFRVHSGQIQEREFEWHKGDTEKFSVKWEVDKDLDVFSYFIFWISISGKMNDKNGKVKITIEGALRTEYPQETFWERTLLYEILRMFWHRTFYVEKRDEYIREGRRLIGIFQEELKKVTHKNL